MLMKILRRHRLSIAVILITLQATWQVVPAARGATIEWSAGSSSDLVWGNVLNWAGGVPTVADDAVFVSPIPNPGSLPNPHIVLVGAASVANSLSLKNAYTLSGGDLTLASGGVRVDMGVVARVDSILAGSAGLTKSGGGSLRLTGANAYTGITTINNGSLIIGDAAALGADSSTIIVNGSPTRGTSGGALVLEGGYSLEALSQSVMVALQTLVEYTPPAANAPAGSAQNSDHSDESSSRGLLEEARLNVAEVQRIHHL